MNPTLFVSIANQTILFHIGDSFESISAALHQAKPHDWCFVTPYPSLYVLASMPEDFSKKDLPKLFYHGIQLSKQHSPTHSTKNIRFAKVGVV